MKFYVIGYKGYIGRELMRRGFLALDCDVRDRASVQRAAKYSKPDLVIHLAGHSSVNFCEEKKNEREVTDVNVMGAGNVFRVMSDSRIPCVFISSDHIFHGGVFETHKEDSKLTRPVNFYGLCKLAAEQSAQIFDANIIRTSYIFDSTRLYDDILDMDLRKYPTFIKRSFLHLYDFCDMLKKYCDNFYTMPKVLHLSGSMVVSWHTFAKEIARQYGYKSPKPRFFDNKNFPPRPHNGGLDVSLSHSLGFPGVNYVSGIERMKHEG